MAGKIQKKTEDDGGGAKFPYTTKPKSLRKLLKEIPNKPKPPKFNRQLLKSWGYTDGNDHSTLRVLKAVGLLSDRSEPTETYSRFMNVKGGAQVLGGEIKRVYAPLFSASHKPFDEPPETLRNLFNIHSGGGDRNLALQLQTFKSLCDSAIFDGDQPASAIGDAGAIQVVPAPGGSGAQGVVGQPVVNINLHIHLPENKSRRDYEDIIEDIGRYIFGRTDAPKRD